MSTTSVAILVVIVLAVVLGFAWFYLARRRRDALRGRFGPEYDRTVREEGSTRRAEAVLEERERKVAAFRVRRLDRDEAQRYREAWRRVQARFVDEPDEAVLDADRLIADVMHTRGYPTSDFDARAEHLSVDYGRTVNDYRIAHEIVEHRGEGAAGTESLRQAMVHYRALFADLVGSEDSAEVRRRA
jgi:hypothetical protein